MAQLGAPNIEMSKFLRGFCDAPLASRFFRLLQIFYVSLLLFFLLFFCIQGQHAQQPKPEKWHRNPEWAALGF